MNKAELIESIGGRLGDRKVASTALDAVLAEIQTAVTKGDKVSLIGFGVFERRERAARIARNPRTGETVKVKKTAVPAFRPGTGFKELVAVGRVAKPTKTVTAAPAKAAAKPAKSVAAATATATRSKVAAVTTKTAPAKRATAKTVTAKTAAAKPAAVKTLAPKSATKTVAPKSAAVKTAAVKTVAKAPAKKAAVVPAARRPVTPTRATRPAKAAR